MKPLIYVETTIPSYYCDVRPELAGDIARTRQWWDEERGLYECLVTPRLITPHLSFPVHPTQEFAGLRPGFFKA